MGDTGCTRLRERAPELNPYQLDKLINSWDASQEAFNNLIGTVWTFDSSVYYNSSTNHTGILDNPNFTRYNKLQILSDKILISNLTSGFRDTNLGDSAGGGCAAGYIELPYALDEDELTEFLSNENIQFKVKIKLNQDDTPQTDYDGGNIIWVEVTVDPLLEDESSYEAITNTDPAKGTIRRNENEPLKGLRVKLELNFGIEDCGITVNRLRSTRQGTNTRVTYWERIFVRNLCDINNSLLSNHAVMAKCLKYKAGNYADNIKNLYHNLVTTALTSKGLIRSDLYYDNNSRCPEWDEEALTNCINDDPESINETSEECAAAVNCAWKGSVSRSMGVSGGNACPSTDGEKRCLLDLESTTRNTVDNVENSLGMYYAYQAHINPYNQEISEFGDYCDGNTINQIENVCRAKNIGISYRWEPISCDPSLPSTYNRQTCRANCSRDGSCNSPVLVSEPDLSAFSCDLEGLNQLENYCKNIQESITGNVNYSNLGFTTEQLQIPGYDPNMYPYTGCNESVVESHLMYIRSLLMGELQNINNRINSIIEDDAQALNDYANRKVERLGRLNTNIRATNSEIRSINNNVLATMTRIGQVNNAYNEIKANIIDFNNYLDVRFEKKKREFIGVGFISIFIINILIFLIFFRKK